MGFKKAMTLSLASLITHISFSNAALAKSCTELQISEITQKHSQLKALEEKIEKTKTQQSIAKGVVFATEVVTLTGWDLARYAIGDMIGGALLSANAFIRNGEVILNQKWQSRMEVAAGIPLIIGGAIGLTASKAYLIYLDEVKIVKLEKAVKKAAQESEVMLARCNAK